jgi:hypothetical protein
MPENFHNLSYLMNGDEKGEKEVEKKKMKKKTERKILKAMRKI